MDLERKEQIDKMWFNSSVGKWARAMADGDTKQADNILNDIFKINPSPYTFLMDEEKKIAETIKRELIIPNEWREYLDALEKDNSALLDIMVAHEFALLEL